TTVQLCSTIYNHGSSVISQMLICLEEWMKGKGYNKLSDFRGQLSYGDIKDTTFYERTQFMKYFTNRKV
ncbi:MAG: diguanylate cyclase, partial [Bacteroidales bacterium]